MLNIGEISVTKLSTRQDSNRNDCNNQARILIRKPKHTNKKNKKAKKKRNKKYNTKQNKKKEQKYNNKLKQK